MQASTVDPSEIAKFEAMAQDWWDPEGSLKPLHMLNPCRLDYITAQIAAEFDRDLTQPRPFAGLRVVDIGCGGGLLCEPMARLGAEVLGVDPAQGNVAVAGMHAAQHGLEITYRAIAAEDLVAEGAQFDVVFGMEVIEHVADAQSFLDACGHLVRPGGLMLCSTLNRTPQSYLLAILGAEMVLRWLPRGTHEWSKFVTPDELSAMLGRAGLEVVDRKGFVFDKLSWRWGISERDLSVNYVATALRPCD